MGAGKSTLGQELAVKLSQPFLDLDDYIEEKSGKSISDIFDQDGEMAFRKLERKYLLEVIRKFEGVVALGGGTLQNQHIVDHIKVNGLLIFIETPISVILERIQNNPVRPLLLKEDGSIKKKETLFEELDLLYKKRLPLYEQAELKIATGDEADSEETIKKLIKKIRYHVTHY
jgi:shikimate kinase